MATLSIHCQSEALSLVLEMDIKERRKKEKIIDMHQINRGREGEVARWRARV